jgi:HIP---CoA ligase
VTTIPAVLAATVARTPDGLAVLDGAERRTWRELDADVLAFARGLVALGVRPHETVAVWVPNSLAWIVAASAASRVGSRVVPLSTRAPAVETAPLLERSGAAVLVVASGFLGQDPVGDLQALPSGRSSGTLIPAAPTLRAIVDVGTSPPASISAVELVALGADVPAEEVARRAAAVGPDDLSHVQFTSGTTGTPKGVLLRHGAMVSTTRAWCDVVGLEPGDRYLVASPCSHLAGYKTGVLACTTVGAAVLPEAVFDAGRACARIAADRVTVLQGAPALFASLLDHAARDEHDLSSLRLAVTGASTVPVTLVRRLRDELGIATVLTAYGLTETAGVCTMCRRSDPIEVVASTSGRPIPGVEVRVVDAAGATLGPGEEGDVLVRTPGLMDGYLDDPEATAATVDAAGWLHTGDVGRVDSAGNLTVTDRRKDLVIVGGFNVSPAEVEDVLLAHAQVGAAAVVAALDDRLGEVPAAFVVPAAGAAPAPDALVSWCRERLAGYKVPRVVHVVDALPMTAAGKVRKAELRARLRASSPAPASVPAPATTPAPAAPGPEA